MSVDDHQLTFVMELWRELHEALWSCVHIRRHHPNSRLVLIANESPHVTELAEIAEFVNAEFYTGRQLLDVQHGGRILHQRLDYCLRNPTPFLIKIDADAKLARPFSHMPEQPSLFGTVTQDYTKRRTVQGGCYGMSLEVAQRLYDTEAFLDPTLADYKSTWGIAGHIQEGVARTGRIFEDWICGYVVNSLGFPIVSHADFGSAWKVPPKNPPPYQFAVTHPHKEEARACAKGDLATSTPEQPFRDISPESLKAAAPIRKVGPLIPLENFRHVFEPLQGKRVGLVDDWGNTGDQLIAAAARQLLNAYEIQWMPVIGSRPDEFDVVLLPGGGSMGSYYLGCRRLRKRLLGLKKPCIVLPQSYMSPELGNFEKVYVRDRYSLEHCPEGILAPDLALALQCRAPIYDTKHPQGTFLRQDTENSSNLSNLGDPASLATSPVEYIMLASQYQHVITDRLHFAICSLLCGNTTTLLSNNYHKNLGMWEAWLKDLGCLWGDDRLMNNVIIA